MKKLALFLTALAGILGAVALSGCLAGSGPPGGISLGGTPSGLQVNLNTQQGIWVNGEGKVMAVPDVANLSLGISVQKTTVAEAQTLAAQSMDKVMSVLTASGVDKKDIQTRYFNISQVTRWDNQKQEPIIVGYQVSNTVSVKIKKIDNAGKIIDAVAGAGGDYTRINGISFTISDPIPYYKDARQKAMTDAKAKAEQLAGLAGVALGKPTYITENLYMPAPIYREQLKAVPAPLPAGVPSTPVSPGEMEITINVQVAYATQ